MTSPPQPSKKPRKWIWFLGGIAGAFLFGGWEPFFHKVGGTACSEMLQSAVIF